MANPVLVDIPEDTWTKIADDVTSGGWYIKDTSPKYLQTIRVAGDPAPTDPQDDGKAVPVDLLEGWFSFTAGHDVYFIAEKSDGKVRVDL